MFWVISTAFVLQGVIIAARGPTKFEFSVVSSIFGWSPKSHCSLEIVSGVKSFTV